MTPVSPNTQLLLVSTFLMLPTAAFSADVTVELDAASGFVIQNNGATIERLRVDEATGNISRNGALFVHTTGGTFVGPNAGGSLNSTGFANSAFGGGTLYYNSTGNRNSAFGSGALYYNTTGNANAAFGDAALLYNDGGSNNSAFGSRALFYSSAGSMQSAFGAYALYGVLGNAGSANSAFGAFALRGNEYGYENSAFGARALATNAYGDRNSAFGYQALGGETSDSSAFGWKALGSNISGTDNSAFGASALGSNTTGYANAAFGQNALSANLNGHANSAFGQNALSSNTIGYANSAFGQNALSSITTGFDNSAFGENALSSNVGEANSAFGRSALQDSTGSANTAVGRTALARLVGGSNNVAIGAGAGFFQTGGSNNIYIANNASGGAGLSGEILIGTVGTHTQAIIAGIHGRLTPSGISVLVNSNGVLGTTTSSGRFKQDVQDMSEASEMLMALRPVRFRYREAVAEGESILEYGLIAEEVAEVAPELVAYDGEGQPFSVRYHVLPSLLLNEMQKHQRTIEEQARVIEKQTERNQAQEAQLATLAARLDGLEPQLGDSTRTDQ